MVDLWHVVALVASWIVAMLVGKLLRDLYWRPLQLHRVFKEQGITGPPSRLFVGNLPDIRKIIAETSSKSAQAVTHGVVVSRVLPYYAKWSKAYGETFLMWWGFQPRLMISDPELIKEVLCDRSGNYDRDPSKHAAKDLFGEGMAMLRMNDKWSQQRKMVAMAFHIEKLKAMISVIAACAEENLSKWQAEMDLALEVKNLTADVICRTAFGTSYEAGKRIFELQIEQQRIHMEWERSAHLPGTRFLPTSKNRYRWKLKKEIDSLLHNIVQKRLQEVQCGGRDGYGNDLLGLMMAAKEGLLDSSSSRKLNISMTMQDVIDECKTFFFTGQDTTSGLLAWTMMLLASSPEWQERLREEVVEACGNSAQAPTKLETLNSLKNMNMVLSEALRLYPPTPCLQRFAFKDMKLKSLFIPMGTTVVLPVVLTNHSEKVWGKDAEDFNPNRFAKVESLHATKAFMPFSVGPRACVGQNFAMLEAKLILSMILQRFRFKLSEAYIHSPLHAMTLQPQFGMPMIMSPI